MNTYAHLGQLRNYLKLGVSETGDDDLLFECLTRATRLIDAHCRRRFSPRVETRSYDHVERLHLWLDDDLLELTALATDGGDTLIDTAAALLWPYGITPHSRIDLDRSADVEFTWSDTSQQANRVGGVWGYHPDWENAWQAGIDGVQDDPLTADSTTLTLADVDGDDLYGVAPCIGRGALLRIEGEYLIVTGVNAGANTATVIRGAAGSEAAQHAQGTPVDLYQPPDDVTQAALRLAAWLYQQKDAPFGMVARPDTGGYEVPTDLPRDVRGLLARYVRPRVEAL
jgi:hypothetical protein